MATNTAQVVAGNANPKDKTQINVSEYGGQLVTNPILGVPLDNPNTPDQNESGLLADHVQGIDENATGTNINQGDYQNTAVQAGTAQGTVSTAAGVNDTPVNTYTAAEMTNNLTDTTAAQGTVSSGAQIDPNAATIDTDALAQGNTPLGEAIGANVQQNMTNVLDTRNPLEAAAAAQLGNQGYIDSKATVMGQMDMLQQAFKDDNGNDIIPPWASAQARNVSKIASFSGMSGSAATSALANAMIEASLPIATSDAQFFQTITMTNLSNAQESTINKANILSKMEMMNADNRLAAAIQNSKSFLEMDLANLSNEQQANVIDSQQRFQGLLEDSKQVNAQRLFTAESQNEMDKFYSQLDAQIQQFNAAQSNSMEQFNVNESNGMSQFNAALEDSRDQFYANMQYNIDVANAKWRQTVTLTENEQAFEAAAVDVSNMLSISQSQLNQLWDRSDALLDYVWQSGENEADRASAITIQKMQAAASYSQAKLAADQANKAGVGGIFGTVAGQASASFFKNFDWSSI